MTGGTDPADPGDLAELEARYAALRQAARSPGAEPADVLEAAFSELEGAIDLVKAARAGAFAQGGDGAGNAERGLLRAAFTDAPVPLFLVARDGTVQRVNRAAGELVGAKPGYATGKPFTSLVNLPSRAAVHSQISAAARTGRPRRVRCSMLAAAGPIPGELVIGRVEIRGEEATPLIIAVRDAPGQPLREPPAEPLGAVRALTRRLDLVSAVARLLLENEGFSEARTLQRCARLIAGQLTAWAIVDVERRHRLRRQSVFGPDDARLAERTRAVAAADPEPGTVPCLVHESGHPVLIAHAEDTGALGAAPDSQPLLVTLDATSVLAVPLSDGENRYGVLTLVRPASEGYFTVADLALVEELGAQMALAIRVARAFRRRSNTADALSASLLPKLPEIPGVEIAATYIAATEDPEVGGDFYDVYRTPDGWGLAVGDVCGKGDEAAAMATGTRHAIRVLARRCADPGEVLSGVNEIVLAEQRAMDGGFITANVAHLSWPDGRLRVVIGTAGHPGAVLLRADGAVRMLSGGGLPLGLFPDAEPAAQALSMDPGDVLFLYTDGVAQARGQGNSYFADRLADELTGLAGETAEHLVASMRQAMLDFSGGNLIDDVTMLVLRAGQVARVNLSSAPGNRASRSAGPS